MCEICSEKSHMPIRVITDDKNRLHEFNIFPDGTLMEYVYGTDGLMSSGIRLGQLVCCPNCGEKLDNKCK